MKCPHCNGELRQKEGNLVECKDCGREYSTGW